MRGIIGWEMAGFSDWVDGYGLVLVLSSRRNGCMLISQVERGSRANSTTRCEYPGLGSVLGTEKV